MALQAGTDYLHLPKIQLSQQSAMATIVNGLAVCTPSYVFVVPESAAGSVLVANVFTSYFPGQDMRTSVESLLGGARSTAEVEEKLLAALTADPKVDFSFPLDDLDKFKVTTWWFNLVTLKRKGKSVNRLVIKGKDHKEAFKSFYAQRLGLEG